MLLYLFKYYTRLILIILFLQPVYSQVKIACLGNSITMGALLSNPNTDSYPSQLQQMLGNDYVVYNYGVGYRTLLNGFTYSYTNSSEFSNSILQHYDIIIICLGTNDTLPQYHSAINNFINDYQSLINAYDNFPSEDPPHCFICIPPPIFENYSGHSEDYLVNEIIPRINNVVNQSGSEKVNFYTALENHEELFVDGLHPNVDGHEILANKLKNAILQYLYAPATPTNFIAIGEENLVNLSWNPNTESDLYSYNIYRGIVDNGYKDFLASLDKSYTYYVDTDVENYTTYYYQISATNTSNYSSSRSAQISATPSGPADTTAPSIPTNFTAISYNGYIQLSWDLNTEDDMASYDIYKGTENGGWKDLLVNINKEINNYEDTNIDPNFTYYYQISAKDVNGNISNRSDQINATTLLSETGKYLSNTYLMKNYPNPFNPITQITFTLPYDSGVNLIIYDLMGNVVKSLLNDTIYAGEHTITWDGKDSNGKSVSGGIYFYTIEAGNYIQTRKMILFK